jgi:hypothetical protein
MKTLETFFYPRLKCLYLGKQLLGYLIVFLSAFFCQPASLGYELVSLHSQLTFYKESIQQKTQSHPRFHPAFYGVFRVDTLHNSLSHHTLQTL